MYVRMHYVPGILSLSNWKIGRILGKEKPNPSTNATKVKEKEKEKEKKR